MNFALSIPLEHVFVLAVALFCVGLTGVLVRRNVMFVLMSLEVMMNACGLAFVAAGARWAQADGQIMFMFILALAVMSIFLFSPLERAFQANVFLNGIIERN